MLIRHSVVGKAADLPPPRTLGFEPTEFDRFFGRAAQRTIIVGERGQLESGLALAALLALYVEFSGGWCTDKTSVASCEVQGARRVFTI